MEGRLIYIETRENERVYILELDDEARKYFEENEEGDYSSWEGTPVNQSIANSIKTGMQIMFPNITITFDEGESVSEQ